MTSKICSKCLINKPLTDYSKNAQCLYGVNSYCKTCKKEKDTKYYNKNKEKISEQTKIYRLNNPEKLKQKRIKEKEKRAQWYKAWYDKHKNNLDFLEYKRNNAKNYYAKNKTEINKKAKIKRKNNPDLYKEQAKIKYYKNKEKNRIKSKEYRDKNKKILMQKTYERKKKRLKTDIIFKLKERLRYRTYSILKSKNFNKNSTYSKYIGCSPIELKQYLESKFDQNMTWDNYGSYWVIDHIIPLALAATVEDVYKLCHYTNLQPLEKIANIVKSDNISMLTDEGKRQYDEYMAAKKQMDKEDEDGGDNTGKYNW